MEAWAAYGRFSQRFVAAQGLGRVVFAQLTRGMRREEAEDLLIRLCLIYDTLEPPRDGHA